MTALIDTIKSLRKSKSDAEVYARDWQEKSAAADRQITALEAVLTAEEKEALDPASAEPTAGEPAL